MQLQELEAKLEEEHRQTQKLCIALEQGCTGHGMGAREVGRIAWERIMEDGGKERPPALNRDS
jgi:hypothetical protein